MKHTNLPTLLAQSNRAALGRRVRQFYQRFNERDWAECYEMIDPKLTAVGKVALADYAAQLDAFIAVYGSVTRWNTKLSLHLTASPKQSDQRPFAYVYVVWKDAAHGFHMFRERWVKDGERWYTRVAGLVPNKPASPATE